VTVLDDVLLEDRGAIRSQASASPYPATELHDAKAVPSTLDDSVEAVVDSGERVHVTVPIREGLPMAILEIL
jgi:hypothetical protein